MTRAKDPGTKAHREKEHDASGDRAFGRRATVVAVLIILVVGLCFFNQVVFRGKILTGGDVLAGAAIFDDFAKQELADGRIPLWNPYIFGGMPFYDSMSWNGFVYPTYWIKTALEKIPGLELPRLFFLVIHYLLAGVGMFFYLRSRKVGHAGATAGGLAFMLTPHLVGLSTIGHAGKVMTAAYIPLVLLAAERVMETGNRRWLAALALLGGLQLLARHVQVSYYTWIAVAILLVFRFVTRRDGAEAPRRLLPRATMVVAAGLLAAAIAAVLLLPLHEYSAFSTRVAEDGGMGFEQATMWSFHPKELLTFLVPSLFGLADTTYWGPMPFQQVSHYVGFVVLVLAAFAVARKKSGDVRFLAVLAAVGIFLSLGKYIEPIYKVLYVALPGFSRFRVPALFLLLAQFSLAGLAGHGASLLLDGARTERRRALVWGIAAGAIGVVAGLVVLASRSSIVGAAQAALLAKHAGAPGSLIREVAVKAASLAVRDAWFLIGIAAATAAAFALAGSKRLVAWAAASVVLALLTADLMLVDLRFMHPEKMQPLSSYYPENATVAFLKAQPGPFRIVPVGSSFSSNEWMYHRIESIGGYHPAKLAVIDRLLEQVGIGNLNVLALLNVKYVVGPESLDHPAFVRVAPGVHEYRATLPRAFLVGEARTTTKESGALAEIGVDSFDPRRYAIVLGDLPGPVESTEGSSVDIVSYAPNQIEVRARAVRPCLLMFSEVYYRPGWKAFVDGVETKIMRADYAFRSVYLKPGDHAVVMRYVPTALRTGLLVTLLAVAAVAVLWALPFRVRPESREP
jgi:hypothetical protein